MRPFFLFPILFFCSLSFAAPSKLIILGDSLTEGYGVSKEAAYPALLEKKLKAAKKDWDVINAGVSGSTSASGPSRLKWLFKNKPHAVLLVLGANDGLRGLKVPETQKNLAQSIEFIQKEKVKVILGGLYMPPNYGKEYTSQFSKMYSDLAKKYKTPFIPFILDKVAGDPKYNLADGIHPNEEGHKIIAEHIYNSIKDQL